MESYLKNCRCCSNEPGDDNLKNLMEQRLASIYFNCTGIEIDLQNQKMPLNVCEVCLAQLNEFDKFREKCKKMDGIYRELSLKCETLEDLGDIEEALTEEVMIKNETYEELNDGQDGQDQSDSDNDDEVIQISALKLEQLKKTTKKIPEKSDTKNSKRVRTKRTEQKEKKEIFPCTIEGCKRRFFVKRLLDGHIRTHSGLKAAQCLECDKQFAKLYHLDEHMIAVHSNLPLIVKCDFEDCPKVFATDAIMRSHRRSHTYKPIRPTEKEHVCHECGKAFLNFARLKKHCYSHLSEKPFKCLQCPKSFVTKHKLKNHTMRHDGIKNFECPHCGMKKTTKEELRKHINCHTKEVTYTCIHCLNVFSTSAGMKRHVKNIHGGVRDFHCTYCDQSFAKSETLKHHTMTHTGERPHVCNVCSRGFIQKTAMLTHMATHRK